MRLLVDTTAWFALNARTDQNHGQARAFLRSRRSRPLLLYVTDYIIDETLTLLRLKVSHQQALNFLDRSLSSPLVVRAHVTPELLGEAETIFRRHEDKMWSYTDCVSFAFMDEIGLDAAFGFDHHFIQYGKTLYPPLL